MLNYFNAEKVVFEFLDITNLGKEGRKVSSLKKCITISGRILVKATYLGERYYGSIFIPKDIKLVKFTNKEKEFILSTTICSMLQFIENKLNA